MGWHPQSMDSTLARLKATYWAPEKGKAFRGTRPPDADWESGSRQVKRRAMFMIYFTEASRYDLSRGARRVIARTKANRVYRENRAVERKEKP